MSSSAQVGQDAAILPAQLGDGARDPPAGRPVRQTPRSQTQSKPAGEAVQKRILDVLERRGAAEPTRERAQQTRVLIS